MEGKLIYNESGWQVATDSIILPLHPHQCEILQSDTQSAISLNNKSFEFILIKYMENTYAVIQNNLNLIYK